MGATVDSDRLREMHNLRRLHGSWRVAAYLAALTRRACDREFAGAMEARLEDARMEYVRRWRSA